MACPDRTRRGLRVSAGATVGGVLRAFLPEFLRSRPALDEARRRAVWAITHCRTATMGGHLHVCPECRERQFAYHSCNHRSCPLCGGAANARWVERELARRVGAPYFMVTFTLPAELRGLFFGPGAKAAYDVFFAAGAAALRRTMARPRWLGAERTGFTGVLHTWNQRLLFHPHIHFIVPGAGIDARGRVATVKNANFLVPVRALSKAFAKHFAETAAAMNAAGAGPGEIDPAALDKDWGVHIQPFGKGAQAIKYLGRYVCRTAIGDSRILGAEDGSVSFRWIDRARGGAERVETIPGAEFVRRYLRHVLPRGMKAIRHFGFCHPTAKARREQVALHTGRPLLIGHFETPAKSETPAPRKCPCCGAAMFKALRFRPLHRQCRAPPHSKPSCAPQAS